MSNNRVKISSIIQNLVPEYVKENYPLSVEFIRQYYKSLDSEGGVLDLLQNIDKYVDVDHLVNYVSDTTLTQEIIFSDDTINVVSTQGFPDTWGLIKINDEIICYEKKTDTQFINCYRGFSGITSYKSQDNPEELVFSTSDIAEHSFNDVVLNLNANLLSQFFKKLKVLITPGFEDKDFFSQLNKSLFVKQSGDFYRAKGTDSSFKILFGALFGKSVEVIRPRDFLIEPSAAQYRITKDLVVEAIEGNPENLVNSTLYQDDDGVLSNSSGVITKVEKILRDDKTYYVLSLDYDYNKDISVSGSVFGDFNIHPKTKIVNEINELSYVIDVDSTVGFPENGELVVDLENGVSFVINYQSKSINQFYNCSGILTNVPAETEVKLNVFAYGYDADNLVKVRITGVISDVKIPKTKFYSKNQTIKIGNLGYSSVNDARLDNWLQNFSIIYDVKSIELVDASNFSYKVEVYDLPSFNLGDSATIISNTGEVESQVLIEQGSVISFDDKTSFIIGGQGELDVNLKYRIRKNLTKAKFSNFPLLSDYNSNVQSTYFDLDDSSVYIASSCLPLYNQNELETIDGSIIINDNFIGEILNIGTHYFYTGDSVTYNSYSESSDLTTGIYFVERVSSSEIKLARSKNNIHNNKYIQFNGLLNGILTFTAFTGDLFTNRTLSSQNIVRKIPSLPTKSTERVETKPGYVGIFNNGVELLNYKSRDVVYFGEIESVSVTAGGSGYDVMRPPVVNISDEVGVGATVYAAVRGELEEIQVIDSGFDYLDVPEIIITGGNGRNAEAETNLITVDHVVQFTATSTGINTSTNVITTIESHKFRDYEELFYDSQSQSSIGGLVSGASYFIEILSANQLKLFPTLVDATNQTNVINLTSFGEGNHILKAKLKKNKIQSISIKSSGTDYKNRKCVISSAGINTASNLLNIENHLFENKDIIKYSTNGIAISGLIDNAEYYVKVVDVNNIRLCAISTVGNQDTNYSNNIFVDFVDVGVGDHYFNHKPIEVSVNGIVGVSSYSSNECAATIQPIFSGEIYSVFIHNPGSSYGSESIINYNKQPEFLIDNGSKAQVKPIISNGRIVDVVVLNPGTNYTSPPDLVINGDGVGASLTPIINSGILEDIKVISTGSGYTSGKTNIEVVSRGSGSKFFANIKQWRINTVSRAISSGIIKDDDGFIQDTIKGSNTLEYSHAYAPRKLREIALAKKISDGKIFYNSDLQNDYNTILYHSPIIGWAYDGNPIYGPYGYTSPSGGEIKALRSGYELNITNERPSTSIYPIGFFVRDYIFTNSGDLDESNGRFCITPEFPNGTYAYFATVDPSVNDDAGIFDGYRKPIFPYVIGNTFKSTPIDFNFDISSNQNDIDFNKTGWVRNTKFYNLFSDNSEYGFLFNPNKTKNQITTITNTSKGKLSGFNIVSGGKNYSIQDKIIIHDGSGSGRNARAVISKIDGVSVSKVSAASTFVNNIEVLPFNNSFIGISTIPHGFNNEDLVTVTTDYEYNQTQNIQVPTNNLTLISTVQPYSTTGIVTFFNVVGNLERPLLRENDTYTINEEKIKVLAIDKLNSRIKVERNYDNTLGISTHLAGTILTQNENKLFLNVGVVTNYKYKENREYYINPVEAVGIGTSYGVGVGHTLNFSNPGAGITSLVIPTKTVYIPSHQISTGDVLAYNANGGTQVSISTDGIANTLLSNNTELYAVKISNDLISLAQERVGINSVGEIVGVTDPSVGLLYFTGIGTGINHSFKTTYNTNINATVSQNVVTVFTDEKHNLSVNDVVNVDCKSGITTTIKIQYNDYNRRILVNPLYFEIVDVNVESNIIKIQNHNLTQGQKIIHTSTTPSGGLENQGIYYVQYIDENQIKLTRFPYNSQDRNVQIVDVTSASFGYISPVNPPIEIFKNSTIIFDLSDSTLSFNENSVDYPAFDFILYTDSQLTNEFNSTKDTELFEVKKIGTIGIDSDAKVILTVNDSVPSVLYYNLVPINLSFNSPIKTEIIVDDLVSNYNTIKIKNSLYNGNQIVKQSSPYNFSYYVLKFPEQAEYTSENSTLKYTTTSSSARGGISSIRLISSGNLYDTLPLVSVLSATGSDAIIFSDSEDIGSALKVQIEDIGFDYNCDLTLRPLANFPTILKVEPLSAFDYIGISSVGRNYTVAPNLVVIDSFTNQVVEDVSLTYELGDSQVTILNNSNGFYNVNPKLIPVNNTNGISIRNIDFNIVNKDVIVTLGSSFSDPESFPFQVGDKVLIENVVVNESTGVVGYNSKNYNYSLFELTNIDSNISGIAVTVAYNLSELLGPTELPGIYDNINSYGRIIAEKEFPIFGTVLKKNNFFVGENVATVSGEVGVVENWDKVNERLVLSSIDNFTVGSLIVGESSNGRGIINQTHTYSSYYDINPSSIVIQGWITETGFLNNSSQRLIDSNYYQYFSYSLKSEIDISKWDETVSNLNHTAGFKKFGDLQIISKSDDFSGISTEQSGGGFTAISDLSSVVSPNCFYDFDLVREDSITLDNQLTSNEVYFNSRVLQNYIESIGNRVLTIDDISPDFNNVPRVEKFSIVEVDRLVNFRSKKYITFVQDRRFSDERQILIVDSIHNNNFGFLNQYANVGTYNDLGTFDFTISGDESNLDFYPIKNEINDYNVNYVSYTITDATTGIGTTFIGDGFIVGTDYTNIPSGISTAYPIVGIDTQYNKGKVLIQISDIDETYFEYNEFNYISDGTTITFIDYGQITTGSVSVYSSPGIGTYSAEISGSQINILLDPDVGLAKTYKVSSIIVGLANTTFSGIGTTTFSNSKITTFVSDIPSSASPGITTIANYPISTYSGAYYIIGIENLTDNTIQFSEFVVCNGISTASYVEYGTIESSDLIGEFSVSIVDNFVNLEFTPIPSVQTQVKVYQHSIGVYDPVVDDLTLDFNNAFVETGYGFYYGTNNAIKKDFNLTYNGNPIFQRVFNPQSVNFNLLDNTIRLPQHFFVTGEKITYDPGLNGAPIGIVTTNVVGIGSTDLLPSTLYIVKQNDLDVKVAISASNALATNPITVEFSSSGIGTEHNFTSIQQNSKVLISIDNVIQAPLVSLGSTTILQSPVTLFVDTFTVEDSTDLFGADLIKIDDEIMRINIVGIGSTGTILVQRPWFGTELANHNTGSLITKVEGDYNIRNNTISFIEAPYGLTPIEDSNSVLDLDYTGIQTSATFSGRVFIRSGEENGLTDTYLTNYVLDNLSPQFTGITSEFTLQQEKSDIVGVATDHAIILVNQILQQPKRDSVVPIEGNYEILDDGGSSTIQFNGYMPTEDYDINSGTLPRGGVILSIGSTQGYGYQPLVSAAGTAIVSAAGTISNISIGNTGSGYRAKKTYDVLTSTTSTVGIGSTVIMLDNVNNVFDILSVTNTGNNCNISIGTYFSGVSINGISTNSITISGINTISSEIPIDTPVLINIQDSPVGIINVGVALSSIGITTITNIGFAQINQGNIDSVIITNPGTGYTSTNTPTVIFEAPLPYENLPLIYSTSSQPGIGTGARVNVVVGQGSSVVNFEISNYGYAYNKNDILTISTGGLYDVPLDASKPYNEFNIQVTETYEDEFSGWVIGDLQVIDPIDDLFDGIKTQFPIEIDGQRNTIRAKAGSNIDVQATLIVTINDVLQIPGEGFIFNGGSTIRFTSPPKAGDTSKILFYRGTTGVDTQFTDVLSLVKNGDRVTINSDTYNLQQTQRIITDVLSTDAAQTNLYGGNGIISDITTLRPITLCQQRNDIFINGKEVTKDREIYDYSFTPNLRLLKTIDPTSTDIFVDNCRPYLSSELDSINSITLTPNISWVGAAASAIVSIAGTVSSIIINEGGDGYTVPPIVSISYPIGFGTTVAALGVASVSSGIVTMITVTSPGSFYTTTNPPQVLIESPKTKNININNIIYEGDFGTITGIAATSITGIAPIGLELDFYIPENSYLRDESIVGSAITISGIQTGYYFVIDNSNIGNSPVSYDAFSNVVGFGSTYLDGVYEVAQVSIASSTIPGVGATFVQRVVVKVSDNSFSGITTNYYGDFSWGRISGFSGAISTEMYSFYA